MYFHLCRPPILVRVVHGQTVKEYPAVFTPICCLDAVGSSAEPTPRIVVIARTSRGWQSRNKK